MKVDEAVEKLKEDIDLWYEFWDGAKYHISEETIEAIKTLIEAVKQK